MRVGSRTDGEVSFDPYARELADVLKQVRLADCLKISHRLHLRAEICSETLLQELATFDDDDRVGIVSLMDHTPGQRQFRDLSALKTYLSKKRSFTNAQFDAHVGQLQNLQRRYGDVHERGAIAEARRLGAALSSHDDTTREQVARSAEHGVAIAEFPTTLEAAEACREQGIDIMVGAPNLVRGGSHSGNVSALTLAEHQLVDIVSSDYIPAALLQAAFRLAEEWEDLPRAVATVTSNPARAVGLSDRGNIALGQRADLVRCRVHEKTPLVCAVWSMGRRVT